MGQSILDPTKFVHWLKCDNSLFLTFDDGPNIQNTSEILDILKKRNGKATFFTIGWKVKQSEDLIKRMVDEGHSIGIHAYNHVNGTNRQFVDFCSDFDRSMDAICSTVKGYRPSLYRPPYGEFNEDIATYVTGQGIKMVGWSSYTRDWVDNIPNSKTRWFMQELCGGSIHLLHDGWRNQPATIGYRREVVQAIVNAAVDDSGMKLMAIENEVAKYASHENSMFLNSFTRKVGDKVIGVVSINQSHPGLIGQKKSVRVRLRYNSKMGKEITKEFDFYRMTTWTIKWDDSSFKPGQNPAIEVAVGDGGFITP